MILTLATLALGGIGGIGDGGQSVLRPPDADCERFLAEIVPVAESICPLWGIDPAECVQAAIDGSRWGASAAHFNYFGFEGRGDAGSCLAVTGTFHGGAEGGGWSPHAVRMARFRSPGSAVTAWCRMVSNAQRASSGA